MAEKKTQIKKEAKHVVLSPRVTEKSAIGSEKGVYVFNVAGTAHKKNIIAAIKELYKVTPVDVRLVNYPGKKVFTRGKVGFTSGGKKAYVALKKGDKIEFA